MFNKKESIRLFVLCCIPVRFMLSIIPLYLTKQYLFYYGILLGIIGFSFLYLYFANKRLKAPEGGGNTWWAKFRIIHGLLYICAAIYSLQGKKTASVPLLLDTFFGFILFFNKNFLKL